MIIINTLEELEQYKTEQKYNDIVDCNEVTYIFKKNNDIQDVKINININFSLEEQLKTLQEEEPFTRHCFVAKDIMFNNGCRFYKLIADNIHSKIICDIEMLEIKNCIKANSLSCEKVSATKIEANSLIVSREIDCKDIIAKKIVYKGFNDIF